MDELSEFKIEGGDLVLTDAQRELVYEMAQVKLLTDLTTRKRLRTLQFECAVDLLKTVKARHRIGQNVKIRPSI